MVKGVNAFAVPFKPLRSITRAYFCRFKMSK
jgi:hypothetical protein